MGSRTRARDRAIWNEQHGVHEVRRPCRSIWPSVRVYASRRLWTFARFQGYPHVASLPWLADLYDHLPTTLWHRHSPADPMQHVRLELGQVDRVRQRSTSAVAVLFLRKLFSHFQLWLTKDKDWPLSSISLCRSVHFILISDDALETRQI